MVRKERFQNRPLGDFFYDNIVRTTGCPSADYVLMICYAWIADELCGYQIKGGEA